MFNNMIGGVVSTSGFYSTTAMPYNNTSNCIGYNINNNINNYISNPYNPYYVPRTKTFLEKLEDEIKTWHGNLLKEIGYG